MAECDEVVPWIIGEKFDDDEVQEEVMTWFKAQAADFYDSGIQKLVPRLNTLWTGDVDLRLYITTVQDGWRKSAF